MSSFLSYPWTMVTGDHDRWMGAWLALLRTHARLWDQLEAEMRRDHGLTIARYDVLTQLDSAAGRLRLSVKRPAKQTHARQQSEQCPSDLS